jgi:anaerobic carbon-monoxide dehydrogenase iron sulfur subunit
VSSQYGSPDGLPEQCVAFLFHVDGVGGPESVSEKRLKVFEERCVGCRICELSCAMSHHQGAFNPRYGLIRVESNREIGLHKPVSHMDYPHICRQCEPAPCVDACPVEAYVPMDGLSIQAVDLEACIGCGQCREACPYGMVLMNYKTDKAMKCDLCGGDPLCVRYCPVAALVFEEKGEGDYGQ